jgi:hypothetical protein
VNCPKCQSDALSVVPAEIRLYRNTPRTLSHPPMSPSPDVNICLDCGWSEFSIPPEWLSAGWLRPVQSAKPLPRTTIRILHRELGRLVWAPRSDLMSSWFVACGKNFSSCTQKAPSIRWELFVRSISVASKTKTVRCSLIT